MSNMDQDDFLFRAFGEPGPNPVPQIDPGTPPQAPVPPAVPTPGRKNPVLENIESLGTTTVPSIPSNIHCLTIIGQVEGHMTLPPQNKTTKYEHLIPQLVAVEQNLEVEGLLVILNTVGGDVEAGLAIAELIASLSKPSVSLVLGGGHSIGGPIAVATTYSYIASTATMTIHPIRLTGLVIGVPMITKMHRVATMCKSYCAFSLIRPSKKRGEVRVVKSIGSECVRWRKRRGGRSVRLSTICA